MEGKNTRQCLVTFLATLSILQNRVKPLIADIAAELAGRRFEQVIKFTGNG